jgi:hypothetical protein
VSDAGRDDFYVGYLPSAPAALARWTKLRVTGIVLFALALVPLLVLAQNPFSKAAFEFGTTRAFEGVIEAAPYPVLVVVRPGEAGEAHERTETAAGVSRYLLVAFGKRGANDLVAAFVGRRVRVEGTLVYRGDQTMIEVLSVTPAADDAVHLAEEPEDLGEHTYVGEIVDSKCFLGVMKPGSTKPHRACATRCISGGVPPVLLVRDDEGRAAYLLLVSASGAAVNADVLDKVAEPVRITGRVQRLGDQLVLRADPAGYERLE